MSDLFDLLSKFSAPPRAVELGAIEQLEQSPPSIILEEMAPTVKVQRIELHQKGFPSREKAILDFECRLFEEMWKHPKTAHVPNLRAGIRRLETMYYYGPYFFVSTKEVKKITETRNMQVFRSLGVAQGCYLLFQSTPDVVRVIDGGDGLGRTKDGKVYSYTPQIRCDYEGNVGIVKGYLRDLERTSGPVAKEFFSPEDGIY